MAKAELATPQDDMVVWFEIPAADFDRAVGFYEHVLKVNMQKDVSGPYQMGLFPARSNSAKGAAAHGCIISGEGCKPGGAGTMVYVNAGCQLKSAVGRVVKAGGEIMQDVTPLPGDRGHYAIIRDTEGNRIGLHAMVLN